MSVDWTQPIQTKSGLKAALLKELRGVGKIVLAVVVADAAAEMVYSYSPYGRLIVNVERLGVVYVEEAAESDMDIINVPIRVTYYAALCRPATVQIFGSLIGLKEALVHGQSNILAATKIEFEEGQYGVE